MMKKGVFLVLVLFSGGSFAQADSKWTCYRYVNGEPTGGVVYVYASDKEDANHKAMDKYQKMHYRIDSVNCR